MRVQYRGYPLRHLSSDYFAMDNKYNTNYSSGLVRLDDALKLSRNTS